VNPLPYICGATLILAAVTNAFPPIKRVTVWLMVAVLAAGAFMVDPAWQAWALAVMAAVVAVGAVRLHLQHR
jgi:hypothetical protein